MTRRASGIVHLWLMALLLSGCYSAETDVVPVSGRVTLRGKPLPGAVVTLQPVDSSHEASDRTGSTGGTDSEGRFSLTLIKPSIPGAVVGRHRVTITTAKSSANDAQLPRGELVPPKWRNGSEIFEVLPGGTSEANFEL
jgi:hypothetical protein